MTSPNMNRQFSRRHIHLIALGAAIGTGFFYGSAEAISLAGPVVILVYALCGLAVFLVMRSLGEMAVHNPLGSSFGTYAAQNLSPGIGFITGWIFALEIIMVALADATACGMYLRYWFPNTPQWMWVSVIIAIIGLINLRPIRFFAETESVLCFIKITAIVAIIIGGCYVLFLTRPINSVVPSLSNLWTHGGFLPNGIAGAVQALSVVIFSFGGIEIIGITAGDSKDPRTTIPHAINLVPIRILLFYVLSTTILMSVFPWNSVNSVTSPFVQMFNGVGIQSAAAILNFVVLIAALSAVNSCLYGAGRMMYSLSLDGYGPAIFTRKTRKNVTWVTVSIVILILFFGAFLNYFMPQQIFFIIASLASFATIWVLSVILLSQLRFRKKIKASAVVFPAPFWPYAQIGTLAFMLFVIFVLAWYPSSRLALSAGCIYAFCIYIIYKIGIKKNQFRKIPT